jgi:hypothetical protein
MERIAEANDALMISGWACCKLSTGIMCGSSTPHRSRITGGKTKCIKRNLRDRI